MLKIKVDEMKVFSVSGVVDLFGVDSNDIVESGVYSIRSEDRGDVVSVDRVEVVDGMFEVENRREMINMLMKDIGGDEGMLEYFEEFVFSYMNSEYDGVYSIGLSEEDGIDIVKVEV